MKMLIGEKRKTLKAYDIAGHVLELVENNINYTNIYCHNLKEFEMHLHSTFYNSNIFFQIPSQNAKSLFIKYLLAGGFCEFNLNMTNNRFYEVCFEDHFDTFNDFVRNRINDQYFFTNIRLKKKYNDFYFLYEEFITNIYFGEKGRFYNKSILINILKIAISLEQEFETDKIYKWESVKDIAKVIIQNGFIPYVEALKIVRNNKLSEI